MTREEWIAAHKRDLVERQGSSERSASLLAVAVADAHTRITGANADAWPAPDTQVRFSTTPDDGDAA
jgi:hypothetical protein